MNLNFNYNGKTLLENWWVVVKENFETIQTVFNNHRTNSVIDHPDSSVTTAKLADKSVTTAKLADKLVTAAKLSDKSVTADKLADDVNNKFVKLEQKDESINQRIDELAASMAGVVGNMRSVTFKWIGDPPEPYLMPGGEPWVDINLDGMFAIDGKPCGNSGSQQCWINDASVAGNGMTYIVAQFNTKTYNVSVHSSDTKVEQGYADNIYTVTVAEYNAYTEDDGKGGLLLFSGITTLKGSFEFPIYLTDILEIVNKNTDDISELKSQVTVLDAVTTVMREELGTMTAALDAINGETEE